IQNAQWIKSHNHKVKPLTNKYLWQNRELLVFLCKEDYCVYLRVSRNFMKNPFYNKLQRLFEIEIPEFDELYSLLKFKEIKKNDFVLKENDTCKFIGLLEEGIM